MDGVLNLLCDLKIEVTNFSGSSTFTQERIEMNGLYKQEKENEKLNIQQPSLLTFSS